MAGTALKVKGLRELQRACKSAEKATRTEVTKALRGSGGPVRDEAENQAGQIRNITPAWSGMKIGSTAKSVYVAPSARRGGGSSRPNLGGLLKRAMVRAVERKEGEVVEKFEDALDNIANVFERR